jgi:hypothetical protein
MAAKQSLLEQMRARPQSDWSIDDVKKLCTNLGLGCRSPASGSHYVVYSEILPGALTVPARRPIKAPYIRKLVALASSHIAAKEGK